MAHSLLALLIVIVLLAGITSTVDAAGPRIEKGFLAKTVSVKGQELKYVVFVPPSYDPKKAMPTIVFLNGAGECGTDGWKQVAQGIGTAIMFGVEKWPFIVLFPQKQDVRHAWEGEQDMVLAILEKTEREMNVDKSRVYLTGLSQGGHGTWAIAASHPELFAAIAPVCGWGDEAMAKKLAKMPIWTFHGDQDTAVNVQSAYDMEKFVKAAGGSVKLTVYPGVGHNSWDKAYREEKLYEWFLQYRKK